MKWNRIEVEDVLYCIPERHIQSNITEHSIGRTGRIPGENLWSYS